MIAKKRMISGIKPTGKITLGNYLGAIKQFIKYQDEYDLWVFIADLHALTLPIDPKELRENTANLAAVYIAAGLDPNKTVLFKQSSIHYGATQLSWILTCNTALGELTKMPQYKNYCENHLGEGIPTGMLMYPSLMSADILLYDADYVPVGIDQKSHVDLCRDMAEKFNKHYPHSFKLPEAIIPAVGAKIMSLSNPTKKMSKSESDKGTIYILDDIEISKKKIMKSITDSENKVYYDPENKPGISNLLTIYSCLSGEKISVIEDRYKNIENYGIFKRDLCNLLEAELKPLQEKVSSLLKEGTLRGILSEGASKARNYASRKLSDIYFATGLLDETEYILEYNGVTSC